MPASGRGRKRPRGGGTAALPPLPHDRQKRFRGQGRPHPQRLFRGISPFPAAYRPSRGRNVLFCGTALPGIPSRRLPAVPAPPLSAPRPLFRAHMAPSRALLSRSPLERPFRERFCPFPGTPLRAPSACPAGARSPPRPEASGCSFRRPAQKNAKNPLKNCLFSPFPAEKGAFLPSPALPLPSTAGICVRTAPFPALPSPPGENRLASFYPHKCLRFQKIPTRFPCAASTSSFPRSHTGPFSVSSSGRPYPCWVSGCSALP